MINRRFFLKGIGTTSLLLLSNITNANTTGIASGSIGRSPADNELHDRVENAIKANFGPDFQLVEYRNNNNCTIATVEHFENRFFVMSSDLHEWKTVASNLV